MTDNSVNIKMIFIILLLISVFMPTVYAEQDNYEILRIYENKNNDVCTLSVSNDGSYLATGSYDNNINFYYTDGDLLWNYDKMEYGVDDISVSSDGSYIAAIDQFKVYLFTKEGKLLWTHEVNDFAISIYTDGSNIVVGSRNGEVTLFDKEGNLLWTFRAGADVNDVSISSNGLYIVAGSSDHNVYLFNIKGKLIWNHRCDDVVMKVSISPNGSFIAASSTNDIIYQFNQDGEILSSRDYSGGDYSRSDYYAIYGFEPIGLVEGIYISSDGLYIASRQGYVYFYRDDERIWEYYTGSRIGSAFSISSDGAYIATNSYSDINLFTNDKSRLNVNLKKSAEDVAHIIERSRSEGFNFDWEKQLLLDAEVAYGNGEYTEARRLALRTEENVGSNIFDSIFMIIIIIAIVTFLLIGLLLKIGLIRLNKIRKERKRLYKEKLKRNEEARCQKEKMKHEILNVIEDITGESDGKNEK